MAEKSRQAAVKFFDVGMMRDDFLALARETI
jgi:hypothetical protein